jgi:hypothetical protein
MSKSPTKRPAGRPITDENGNRRWDWGSDGSADTGAVRALGEELSLQSSGEVSEARDPYNQTSGRAPTIAPQKRRTLDDMRLLSEEIRNSRHWTPKK